MSKKKGLGVSCTLIKLIANLLVSLGKVPRDGRAGCDMSLETASIFDKLNLSSSSVL